MSISEPIMGTSNENDGDRRQTSRRNVLESHMATASLGDQGSALILDLSENGVGVQSVGGLRVGTSVPVRFTVPDADLTVEGTGRVAWSDDSGRAGVNLESLAPSSEEALKRWFSADDGAAANVPQADPLMTADPIGDLKEFLKTQNPATDAALDYIVRQAFSLSLAEGAAIALNDGAGMICRASIGTAPGVGIRLKGSSGLTGECVQTRQIIRCDDTETDPRADRLLCRRINLRSTIIVPILARAEMLGVIETLSSRPRAFDSSHVILLREIAELTASCLRGESVQPLPAVSSILEPSLAPVESSSAPHVRSDVKPIFPISWAPGVCDVCGTQNAIADTACTRCGAPLQVAPPPPTPRPTAVKEAAATVTPTIIAPAEPAESPRPKAVTFSGAAAAPALAPAIAPVRTPSAATARTHEVAPAILTTTIARKRTPILLAAAAVLLVTISGIGYWYGRARRVAPPPPAVRAAVPPVAVPAPAPVAPAASAGIPPQKLAAKPGSGAAATKPANTVATASASPITLHAPEKVVATPDAPALAAPPVTEIGQRSTPSLVPLQTALPEAAAPTLRVSKNLTPPRLLQKANPVYPDMARRMGVEGDVHIVAVVGTDGKVKNARAVSGPELLKSPALQAVRGWTYEPSRIDGQAVETDIAITIQFHLPRN